MIVFRPAVMRKRARVELESRERESKSFSCMGVRKVASSLFFASVFNRHTRSLSCQQQMPIFCGLVCSHIAPWWDSIIAPVITRFWFRREFGAEGEPERTLRGSGGGGGGHNRPVRLVRFVRETRQVIGIGISSSVSLSPGKSYISIKGVSTGFESSSFLFIISCFYSPFFLRQNFSPFLFF